MLAPDSYKISMLLRLFMHKKGDGPLNRTGQQAIPNWPDASCPRYVACTCSGGDGIGLAGR